jgi:hypothetical protein
MYKYKSFEQYLMEKHCEENPQLLDDMLCDDFYDWLEREGIERIIEFGEMYGKNKLSEGKDEIIDLLNKKIKL